eukprot:NODE_2866_length_456_cov_7.506143_g2268_i0.p2 GENE.NODE_2866_length_456_cov_7.506143_g2268_i0~~NODE_2866_length_456_cov_7.506143_g2268_i0.p2  ORF type:complete len:57 (+),score=7.54 NODE_2866_length_456_cov_7.506143_g2268_i0:129-299(+)
MPRVSFWIQGAKKKTFVFFENSIFMAESQTTFFQKKITILVKKYQNRPQKSNKSEM